MSKNLWLILFGILAEAIPLLAADKENFIFASEIMDFERPGIAAYFGEVQKLRDLLGDQAAVDAGVQSGRVDLKRLAKWAIDGQKYEVLDLLVSYGWPRWSSDIAELFLLPGADADTFEQIAKRVPDFKNRFGEACLREAVGRSGKEAAKWLISIGIRPGTHGSQMLVAAARMRDTELLKLLLDAGADPEVRSDGISALDAVAHLRSAKLLALLDKRGHYAKLLEELQRGYAPSANSPFIGSWIWRPPGGSFGTLQVLLFDDGSATMLTDVGAGDGVWKRDGNEVAVQLIGEPRSAAPGQVLKIQIKDGKLILPPAPGNPDAKERTLERVDELPEVINPQGLYPQYIRLERALIDKRNRLWLQINGRHQQVPIERLIGAARGKDSGAMPVPENMLAWADFKNGPIPKEAEKESTNVLLSPQYASPGYRGDRLAPNHTDLTTLSEGTRFAIYRSGSERFHDTETGPYGEEAHAFAIMTREPFAHGKDWLRVFIRRSPVNR